MPPIVAPVIPAPEPATAATVKTLLVAGRAADARELFGDLVAQHQHRATRIAYHYLRDTADTDEAVQDAFVKAFVHLRSFREELPFEVWFTRILVNGCLDRLKARTRRDRWMVSLPDMGGREGSLAERHPSAEPTPEAALLRRERQRRVLSAVDRLPRRQRLVVLLSQIEGYTTREVSSITGLNETTVRVHLFRAIRSLRKLLKHDRWLVQPAGEAR